MSTQLSVPQLLLSLNDFSAQITALLARLGLDLSSFQADHLALRVNDAATAASLHTSWLTQGWLLSENHINGRPIAVIKLATPLSVGAWQIDCVELPYPGKKAYPQEGWQHIEWVIPSTATRVEDFLIEVWQRFPELQARWHQLEHAGISIKLSSPKGESERLANPTIAFSWQDVCVKLHPASLEAVIASEQVT